MKSRLLLSLSSAFVLLGIGMSADARNRDPAEFDRAAVVSEAEAFMIGYGEDLRRGDRAAVAARYAPEGAIFAGWGPQKRRTQAQVVERYATTWQPPASFRWCGVAVEPLSADVAVVTAVLDWGAAEGVQHLAYTGVLVRRDGKLLIRVEHQNAFADNVAPVTCNEPIPAP